MMALDQIPKRDWYSVLGADPSADASDLKHKYQKLVLMYHPDKQSTAALEELEERRQRFLEVGQAWKVLGNEQSRKEYDLQRHEDELRSMGPVHAQVYLEEMSWNEGDRSFSLSCRCGGRYSVGEQEAAAIGLVPCDTCSLMVELLHDS
ncbi:PREDICTED: dnaJ homolog subfamily C member 24 isoform X1 [Chinchilla lanigera]|uniref:DnaJ homolog subfamily C member 24 n=1 Tax=Chinchilla lanigera TaxID=34839 RepID=A0A8C2UJW0_CHILA|nr:PREDICTED: dnaJ homolog subfamily C member 24 isoform X1 [Chinchilla lanigera]